MKQLEFPGIESFIKTAAIFDWWMYFCEHGIIPRPNLKDLHNKIETLQKQIQKGGFLHVSS